jgi:hypothetical protein
MFQIAMTLLLIELIYHFFKLLKTFIGPREVEFFIGQCFLSFDVETAFFCPRIHEAETCATIFECEACTYSSPSKKTNR